MTTILQSIKPLNDDERLSARDRAKALLARELGEAPRLEQFQHNTESEYPQWITRLVLVLVALVLFAAFAPSAIRLYAIGSETFYSAIPHAQSATIAGLAIVLLAETAQVLFSIASAVLPPKRATSWTIALAMIGATMLALVGNVQVALVGHWESPFAWLEAVLPPLMVLASAYVLKAQLLSAIKANHAAHKAYSEALNMWRISTQAPEHSPRWTQVYANALKASLIDANTRGNGAMARKELLAQLTPNHWRALVARELSADSWWASAEAMPLNAPSEALDDTAEALAVKPTRRPKASATTEGEAVSAHFLAPEVVAMSSNGNH